MSELDRSGAPHRIARAVGGWLALSALLAATLLALLIGWIVWRSLDGRFDAVDAFVATIFLRLALDLPTRCYHSGVYALRRVYKPIAATLAPELIGIGTMVSLWPFAGVWAVVTASVVTTLTTTWLTLLYVRRVYHFLGFAPLQDARPATLRASLRGAARESLLGGFSHASMALDALAV